MLDRSFLEAHLGSASDSLPQRADKTIAPGGVPAAGLGPRSSI
jgi:hypothetical protein